MRRISSCTDSAGARCKNCEILPESEARSAGLSKTSRGRLRIISSSPGFVTADKSDVHRATGANEHV